MKTLDTTREGSQYETERTVAGIGTLHLLHARLAKMNARRAMIPIEMREADARGARKEVVVLFKELCDLILSATRIEADIEMGLSASSVRGSG